jgi:hypothetical protein
MVDYYHDDIPSEVKQRLKKWDTGHWSKYKEKRKRQALEAELEANPLPKPRYVPDPRRRVFPIIKQQVPNIRRSKYA